MIRRLWAGLLAALLLLTSWTAAIAEDPYLTEEELAESFAIRFGADAEVETDGDQRPVSVNGYPFQEVETSFNIHAVEDKIVTLSDFLDYPFWRPATKYDGNLAMMSLFMALCSERDLYRNEDPETFDPAVNVEAYLMNAGFTDIRKSDYSKETSIYTISTAIGSRRMEHEGNEPFTLIAVGVCGGNYKNEWQSNFTAGTDDLHEGFSSASDLVTDRIAGYIATRGITGRVKIWISGFSRAAAVANLTAGRLTHTGAFPKEDVYAYTFATPAAVQDPPKTGDENIFNIISPTDAVPQVMPADWNCGRYGKDLYLPVPEFSSIGEMAVLERKYNIREAFGIDIHYSEALNLRMRLLISLVLEVVESRENYSRNIQDTVVGLLQNKNAANLLLSMRSMLLSMRNGGPEMRGRLDRMLNFMLRVFGNAMTRTELAEANKNSGSSQLLLFTEHREDVYLASITTIQNGWFEEAQEFTYLICKGPAELELTVDEVPGWSMTLNEKGTVTIRNQELGTAQTDPEYKMFYAERLGNASIAAIPHDLTIRVKWKAVSDGTIEIIQARCGLSVSQLYPGATTGEMKVRAGDTGAALLPEQRKGGSAEGFYEKTFSAADLAGFLGISKPFVSWRILVAGVLLLVGLFIFLLIRLFVLLLPERVKKSTAVWCLLALFCVSATEAEGAYWMLADMPLIRLAWEAVAGASVLAVFFLSRNRHEKLWTGVLPGLATVVAADLVMMWNLLPGVVLLWLGHVLLIVSFIRKKPISRTLWIQWAVLSVLAAVLMILVFAPEAAAIAWATAAFIPVLSLMFYSADSQSHQIRHAAGCLLASDILLGLYLSILNEPVAHILHVMLFGVALILLAFGESNPEEAAPAGEIPAVR